jgi:hypothetical protein
MYRLELVVEPWALKYYKDEVKRPNDNAGYDLFCEKMSISGYTGQVCLVNQGVRARMLRINNPTASHSKNHYSHGTDDEVEVHYRLVPRSSICKTSLMMANSEGIIDRTYRGLIKAPVRNMVYTSTYEIEEGQRLFQIVAPDLGHICEVSIVESLPDTVRGEGGFGSTGR